MVLHLLLLSSLEGKMILATSYTVLLRDIFGNCDLVNFAFEFLKNCSPFFTESSVRLGNLDIATVTSLVKDIAYYRRCWPHLR